MLGRVAAEPEAPRKSRATRQRIESARRRSAAARQEIEERRARVRSIDTALSVHEHDRLVGGSLMAGALAFRLFLWMLPAALLVVAELGFLSSVSDSAPSDAVRNLGIHSLAVHSITTAARESQRARWVALIVGLVVLYLASVALMKALWTAHALAWRVPAGRIPAKPRAVGVLLLTVVGCMAATSGAAIVRNDSRPWGVVVMLAVVVVYAGGWWGLSTQLPHGDAPKLALLPGAVLFGIGSEVIHLVSVYYLAAKVTSASELYGALGAASALLLGLYYVSRFVVEGAILNATLWTRKQARPAGSGIQGA